MDDKLKEPKSVVDYDDLLLPALKEIFFSVISTPWKEGKSCVEEWKSLKSLKSTFGRWDVT